MNKRKLVRGVGINDMPTGVYKRQVYCVWANMLDRCYSGRFPDYNDCVVAEVWHLLSTFHVWYVHERAKWPNIRVELEKDLLIEGNRCYSPDTVVIVPKWVNLLLSRKSSIPIDSRCNSYPVIVSCQGKPQYVGRFKTRGEALTAYCQARFEAVVESMQGFPDERIRDAVLSKAARLFEPQK